MTTLALFTAAACAGHDPVPGHPEQPARLAAARAAFDDPRLLGLRFQEAPAATQAQLLRVHDAAHIDRVFAVAAREVPVALDPDVVVAPGSLDAALHAAGAVVAAVDAVVAGPARRAFCLVRPPGHHATRKLAMGFCLFNNIAVGAAHALAAHGLRRVAVVDFDVHHGNGSQAIFWDEPRVLFASSHQWPLYPGSGAATETGGVDNIVNVTLPAGAGGSAFRAAWDEAILPRLDAFAPELLLVSAGFDGHRDDPLAGLNLVADDYGWLTARLVDLADRHAGGRLVSALEGGYDLAALSDCTRAHALALVAAAAA